jgi:hypothetical protein
MIPLHQAAGRELGFGDGSRSLGCSTFVRSSFSTSQEFKEFLDRKPGLVDDRGERPSLEVSAVEGQRDAKLWLIGVLQIIM